MLLDLNPPPHFLSWPRAGQRFTNIKTPSGFTEFQFWGIFFFFFVYLAYHQGRFFWFFSANHKHFIDSNTESSTLFPLIFTSSISHLIKFQSFQRWNIEENTQCSHPNHTPEVDANLSSSSTCAQQTICFLILDFLLYLISLQMHPKCNLNLLFSGFFIIICHVLFCVFSNSFALKVHLVLQ